jgi:hypothetical protein
MRKRYIQFVEFDNGCQVPLTHRLNADGYYRRIWTELLCDSGKQEREMFHRFIYRIHNDLKEIPKGYEINHKCRNRACCNPEHLEMLSRKEHLNQTNRGRYRDRIMAGKYDLLGGMSRKEVAKKYSVYWQTANNWVNQLGFECL